MTLVNTPHESRERMPGRGSHFACGFVGLGVVLALFLTWYSAIAALANALGVLSSTAIVWLFVTTWLGLWLGLDVVLIRWTRSGTTA